MGPTHQPCFPNIYCILVGAPGIGKGLVIREVSDCLKHWKKTDKLLSDTNLDEEQKQTLLAIQEADMKAAQNAEFQGKSKGAEIIKPLLFPVAADATTYEALVQAVADSYDRVNYPKQTTEGKLTLGIYGHSSLCFSLQELASLLRKRTDDTVNYLLGLYDCPLDYEYVTKTKGKDRVRRGCLNLLAGTTPSFMQSTFDDKLADEGFNSRVFYIFAQKNRKNQMWIPPLTEDQNQCKKAILDHILKLSRLYGNVQISPETALWLQEWWDNQEKNKHLRSNKSLKLNPYYSRKNIHVMKVAMAVHFGESVEMTIPLEAFQKAIAILAKEELNMHLAIIIESDNPLAKVAKKIQELLTTGKKDWVELMSEMYGLTNKEGLTEALDFLQETGQVVTIQEEDEDLKTTKVYWRNKQ